MRRCVVPGSQKCHTSDDKEGATGKKWCTGEQWRREDMGISFVFNMEKLSILRGVVDTSPGR